jgi:hypothetical protein
MKATRIAMLVAAATLLSTIACTDRSEPVPGLPPATPTSAPEPPTIRETLDQLGLEDFALNGDALDWDEGNPALSDSPNQPVLLAPVTMVRTHLAEEQLVSIGAFSRSKVLLRYEIIGARPTVDLNAYANSSDHKPETEYVDVYALVYLGEIANDSPGLELTVETSHDSTLAAGIKQPKINKITVESRHYRVIALGQPKRSGDKQHSVSVYGGDGWEISKTETLGQIEFGSYNLNHTDKTQLPDVVRLSQLKR